VSDLTDADIQFAREQITLQRNPFKAPSGFTSWHDAAAVRLQLETGRVPPERGMLCALHGSLSDDPELAAWETWCRKRRDRFCDIVERALDELPPRAQDGGPP
jgi:hypothetical protein